MYLKSAAIMRPRRLKLVHADVILSPRAELSRIPQDEKSVASLCNARKPLSIRQHHRKPVAGEGKGMAPAVV